MQEVNAEGKRVLCRTENYAGSHGGFDSFLRGQRVLSVLQQLAGEEMVLFKEKINYKFAGSGRYKPCPLEMSILMAIQEGSTRTSTPTPTRT
jgi:hypothetical protein